MNRVMIIGCCGAGKSTISSQVARRYDLPLIHLDHRYWKPGWVSHSDEDWERILGELVAEERWLHDGNYALTLPWRLRRADLVIFLDVPRRLCLWRVVTRRWKGGQVAPGCPERLSWSFVRFVWRFPKHHRPRLLEQLRDEAAGAQVVRLRNRAEVREFLTREVVS